MLLEQAMFPDQMRRLPSGKVHFPNRHSDVFCLQDTCHGFDVVIICCKYLFSNKYTEKEEKIKRGGDELLCFSSPDLQGRCKMTEKDNCLVENALKCSH